jgi:hypothetical protein
LVIAGDLSEDLAGMPAPAPLKFLGSKEISGSKKGAGLPLRRIGGSWGVKSLFKGSENGSKSLELKPPKGGRTDLPKTRRERIRHYIDEYSRLKNKLSKTKDAKQKIIARWKLDDVTVALLNEIRESLDSGKLNEVYRQFQKTNQSGERFDALAAKRNQGILIRFAEHLLDLSDPDRQKTEKQKAEENNRLNMSVAKNKMGTLEVWAAPKESRDPKKNGVLLFRGRCEQN